MKLLGLFLIRCVFTKKILVGQKFVKTGTGKNRGFPEHCAMVKNIQAIAYNGVRCVLSFALHGYCILPKTKLEMYPFY